MASNPTYILYRGKYTPPRLKCQKLENWLGRVSKGGLSIVLKPKNPNQSHGLGHHRNIPLRPRYVRIYVATQKDFRYTARTKPA